MTTALSTATATTARKYKCSIPSTYTVCARRWAARLAGARGAPSAAAVLTLYVRDAGQRGLELIEGPRQQLQVADVTLHDLVQVAVAAAGSLEALTQLLSVFLNLRQRRVETALAVQLLSQIANTRK